MKDKYINIESSKRLGFLVFKFSLDTLLDLFSSVFILSFGVFLAIFVVIQAPSLKSFIIFGIYLTMFLFSVWCILGVFLQNYLIQFEDRDSENIRDSVVKNLEFYNPEIVVLRGRNDLLIVKEKGTFEKWNHLFFVIIEGKRILINRASLTIHGARSPFASIGNYLLCRRLRRNWTSL